MTKLLLSIVLGLGAIVAMTMLLFFVIGVLGWKGGVKRGIQNNILTGMEIGRRVLVGLWWGLTLLVELLWFVVRSMWGGVRALWRVGGWNAWRTTYGV